MAVEDDPAWKEWSRAFDILVVANEQLDAMRHLPDSNPKKRNAWLNVKLAQAQLEEAANDIEPKFPPED